METSYINFTITSTGLLKLLTIKSVIKNDVSTILRSFLREWQNWNNEYIYACKKYTKIKISKCNRTLKTYREKIRGG